MSVSEDRRADIIDLDKPELDIIEEGSDLIFYEVGHGPAWIMIDEENVLDVEGCWS